MMQRGQYNIIMRPRCRERGYCLIVGTACFPTEAPKNSLIITVCGCASSALFLIVFNTKSALWLQSKAMLCCSDRNQYREGKAVLINGEDDRSSAFINKSVCKNKKLAGDGSCAR